MKLVSLNKERWISQNLIYLRLIAVRLVWLKDYNSIYFICVCASRLKPTMGNFNSIDFIWTNKQVQNIERSHEKKNWKPSQGMKLGKLLFYLRVWEEIMIGSF